MRLISCKRHIHEDMQENRRRVEELNHQYQEQEEELRLVQARMEDHVVDYRELVNEQHLQRYLEAICDDASALRFLEDVLHDQQRCTLPRLNNQRDVNRNNRHI